MFTQEEKDFIDGNPEFIEQLKSMSDDELSAFRELVSHLCGLSQEERQSFFRRVDQVLADMGRPAVRNFEDVIQEKIAEGAENLKLLDDDYLNRQYERYMKGDEGVMNEVREAVESTKKEIQRKSTQALKDRGYEPKFLKEYRSEIYSGQNLLRFHAGDPALWEVIENYHDEWTYFETDLGDMVVVGVNDNE